MPSRAVLPSVLFVAWSWTENHLLPLHPEAWPKQDATGAMLYREPAVLVRLVFWVALALPTAAWLLVLQLRGGASGATRTEAEASARRLQLVTTGFALLAALLAPLVLGEAPDPSPADDTRVTIVDRFHLLPALLGLATFVLGPTLLARFPRHSRRVLTLGTFGLALAWWDVLVARERTRLARLDHGDLFHRHAERATSAGLVLFAAPVTAWIFRHVPRALR